MLKSLFISSFVIIDQTQVDFEEGMTALTGETGAGKSIIINALEQLCGARAIVGQPDRQPDGSGWCLRTGRARSDHHHQLLPTAAVLCEATLGGGDDQMDSLCLSHDQQQHNGQGFRHGETGYLDGCRAERKDTRHRI